MDNDSQVLDVTIGGSLLAFENLFWSSKLSQFLDNNTRLKFLSINNEHKTTHADLQNIFQALQRNVTLESLVIRDRFARSSWTGGARDESVEEIDYAKGLSTNISLTKLSLAGIMVEYITAIFNEFIRIIFRSESQWQNSIPGRCSAAQCYATKSFYRRYRRPIYHL